MSEDHGFGRSKAASPSDGQVIATPSTLDRIAFDIAEAYARLTDDTSPSEFITLWAEASDEELVFARGVAVASLRAMRRHLVPKNAEASRQFAREFEALMELALKGIATTSASDGEGAEPSGENPTKSKGNP